MANQSWQFQIFHPKLTKDVLTQVLRCEFVCFHQKKYPPAILSSFLRFLPSHTSIVLTQKCMETDGKGMVETIDLWIFFGTFETVPPESNIVAFSRTEVPIKGKCVRLRFIWCWQSKQSEGLCFFACFKHMFYYVLRFCCRSFFERRFLVLLCPQHQSIDESLGAGHLKLQGWKRKVKKMQTFTKKKNSCTKEKHSWRKIFTKAILVTK